MGKGDLDLKISADPQKALNDLAKVNVKLEDMNAKLKRQNTEAKKTTRSMKDMGSPLGKMVKDAGALAAGFLSAQGAIAVLAKGLKTAKAELEDIRRKEAEAAQQTMTFAKDFSKVIGQSFPELIEKLNEIAPQFQKAVGLVPELDINTATALLGAYKGAYPSAGWEQSVRAVTMAGRAEGLEDRPALIRQVGEFQKAMPGKTLDDIFDLAYKMRADAGREAEKLAAATKGFLQLQQQKVPDEESLAFIYAAIDAKVPPRAIQGALTMMARDIKPTTTEPGKLLTDEQRLSNRLAVMSIPERMRWIEANPEQAMKVFGPTFIPYSTIFPGMAEARKTLAAAQRGDIYTTRVSAYREALLGMQVLPEARKETMIQELQMDPERAVIGQINAYLKGVLPSMPGFGPLERIPMFKAIEIKGRATGDYPGAAISALESRRRRFETPYYEGLAFGEPGFGPGETISVRHAEYNLKTAEYMSRMIRDIKDIAESFKGQKAAMDKNTQAVIDNTNRQLTVPENITAGVEE